MREGGGDGKRERENKGGREGEVEEEEEKKRRKKRGRNMKSCTHASPRDGNNFHCGRREKEGGEGGRGVSGERRKRWAGREMDSKERVREINQEIGRERERVSLSHLFFYFFIYIYIIFFYFYKKNHLNDLISENSF